MKNSISVQDATGGIAVRPTSLTINAGEEVTLSGTLAEFRGLLQLESATVVENKGNVGVPAPKVVTGADVKEENESLLVQAKNVTLTAVDSNNNYTATDGTVNFVIRDERGDGNLKWPLVMAKLISFMYLKMYY